MGYILNITKKLYSFKQDIKTPCHIYVYANRKNAGDFLSAKGVKLAVGISGVDCIIEDNDLSSLIENYKNKRLKLIIGGGGLLAKSFESFWQAVLTSGFKYILFGVGVCDIKTRNSLLPDELFKEVINGAEGAWVRDSMTALLIKDRFGINTQQTICPSVYYIYDKYAKFSRLKFKKRPKVLYAHHGKLVRYAGKKEDFVKDKVKECCKLNNFDYFETDNMHRDPDKLLHRYCEADIVVSTRLHGCIFSCALDRPFVAVSADKKIDSFVYDYCNADVRDIEHLTLDMLNRSIQQRIYSSPRKDNFQTNIEKIKVAADMIRNSFLDKK